MKKSLKYFLALAMTGAFLLQATPVSAQQLVVGAETQKQGESEDEMVRILQQIEDKYTDEEDVIDETAPDGEEEATKKNGR